MTAKKDRRTKAGTVELSEAELKEVLGGAGAKATKLPTAQKKPGAQAVGGCTCKDSWS